MTKNDSRAGSEVSFSWRNRNTFRGAELLAIKANVGFESQFGGGVSQPPTYQFGLEPSITFPRFVVPLFDPRSSSVFVPHTKVSVSYDILLRSNLYDLRSFKTSYGFIWKENIKSEHQFYPLNFIYVRTDTLNKDTILNINYGNLVFNGVILGPTYQYTYNSRGNRPPHHHDVYFNGLADLSANVLGLVQGTDVNKNPGDAPKQLLGAAYAQYIKLQADFRYYMNYNSNPNSIWANRIMIGYGLPYGNSTQLPNIKQFFSGGNSSLRGFPSRLVGPGRFYFRDASGKQLYLETYGDIKLELNSELRAQLINFVHGAVFIDAGNVWTYRPVPQYPRGEFTGNFYQDLAVDVGLGLRFDFKILVVRLDLGMPVRKPWLTEGQQWVYNNLDFGNSAWRKENLVLNLGIGYPF
jgi:outer membrane protein assembly factor BamA